MSQYETILVEHRGAVTLVTLNRPQALNALMISRSLERVADHATNIAEDVLFLVKGIDVRHHNEEKSTMYQT